jgi:hypothetical protein
MDDAEIVERYLILLLGANSKPIPSDMHLQKEIFILSNFKDSISGSFDFQKHYFGPYSQVLEEALKNPAYFSKAFEFNYKQIFLSKEGKKEFSKMVRNFSKEENFKILISAMELLRNLYDKLTQDEFMFLVYETYPQYTQFSQVSDKLLKNKFMRNKLLSSIHSKGLITEERYEELKNEK